MTQSRIEFESTVSILLNPQLNRKDILDHSSSLAKLTGYICRTAKESSSNNRVKPEHQKQFLQFGKDIASDICVMVLCLKSLAQTQNEENRHSFRKSTEHLLDKVKRFTRFCQEPDFAFKNPVLNSNALSIQDYLLENNRSFISKSKNLLANFKLVESLRSKEDLSNDLSILIGELDTLVLAIVESGPLQVVCIQGWNQLNQSISVLTQTDLQSMAKMQSIFSTKEFFGSIERLSSLVDLIYESIDTDLQTTGTAISQISVNFNNVRMF